jgi:hypothetical protein
MDHWNAGGLQFSSAQAFRPKASDVRLEFRTVEGFGDFRQLPLAAALIQFVGHQQHGPRH